MVSLTIKSFSENLIQIQGVSVKLRIVYSVVQVGSKTYSKWLSQELNFGPFGVEPKVLATASLNTPPTHTYTHTIFRLSEMCL